MIRASCGHAIPDRNVSHSHMHASVEWICIIIRTFTTVMLLSRIYEAKNIYRSCVDICEKAGIATMNESRASWPSPASWTQWTLPGTWQSYAGALESISEALIIFLIIIAEHHIWLVRLFKAHIIWTSKPVLSVHFLKLRFIHHLKAEYVAFHWCMVWTIFGWDTTIWKSGIWGCKKNPN